MIIAPSYMVYSMNFDSLLQSHIDSEADITLLYHSVDNAKDHFLNCDLSESEPPERCSLD